MLFHRTVLHYSSLRLSNSSSEQQGQRNDLCLSPSSQGNSHGLGMLCHQQLQLCCGMSLPLQPCLSSCLPAVSRAHTHAFVHWWCSLPKCRIFRVHTSKSCLQIPGMIIFKQLQHKLFLPASSRLWVNSEIWYQWRPTRVPIQEWWMIRVAEHC